MTTGILLLMLVVLGRILWLLERLFREESGTPEPPVRPLSHLEQAADVQQAIADTLSRRSLA